MTIRFYLGCDYRRSRANEKTFVLGDEFGPQLLAHNASIEDALNEYDELFGERVEETDLDLRDYEPSDGCKRQFAPEDWDNMPDHWKSVCEAEYIGDVRTNSGGTTVWVSHYEWVRGFQSLREAVAFLIEHNRDRRPEFIREGEDGYAVHHG